jgi:hypothetical protein
MHFKLQRAERQIDSYLILRNHPYREFLSTEQTISVNILTHSVYLYIRINSLNVKEHVYCLNYIIYRKSLN